MSGLYANVEDTARLSERIIDCARESFALHGYRRTTGDDIARSLRISKRTLYGVFSSKEDILREVAWRDVRETMRVFAVTAPVGAPPERMLLELCRAVFADRAKNGTTGIFAGLYREDAVIRAAFHDAFREVIANLYEDGMRHGRLKPVEPGFAGAVILSMITAATDRFSGFQNPLAAFTDTLSMIADAVLFRSREPLDATR